MDQSIVQLMCPNLKCRRIVAAPASARGKTVRCAGCDALMRVPMGDGRPTFSVPNSKKA